MRKYRRGTFTCSSKSTYSFNNDIDEMSEEQDSEDLASKIGAEEDITDVYDLDEHVDVDNDYDLALRQDLILCERDRDFHLQLEQVDEDDGVDSYYSGLPTHNPELESLTSDGGRFSNYQNLF